MKEQLVKFLEERVYWYKHAACKRERVLENDKAKGAIDFAEFANQITPDEAHNFRTWANTTLSV